MSDKVNEDFNNFLVNMGKELAEIANKKAEHNSAEPLNYKDLTMVFRNVDAERVQKLMNDNPDWNALARYDVIEVNQELEEFIRQLSYGNIDDPQTAADDLMTKMKWG